MNMLQAIAPIMTQLQAQSAGQYHGFGPPGAWTPMVFPGKGTASSAVSTVRVEDVTATESAQDTKQNDAVEKLRLELEGLKKAESVRLEQISVERKKAEIDSAVEDSVRKLNKEHAQKTRRLGTCSSP